jgi:predicted secreted Zn-dependent protease
MSEQRTPAMAERGNINTNRTAMTRFGLSLVVASALAVPAAAQEINENVVYETYVVDGRTLSDVADDMAANGPQGYWAYTTWYVNWSAECEITIDASITLPELAEDNDLSAYDEEVFASMLEALDAHEQGHVDFARGFAQEVAATDCDVPDNAIDPWLEAERAYDAETRHGETQGVRLN